MVKSVKQIRLSILTICLLLNTVYCFATNYTVSTKADLIAQMGAALPGDTVIVANGSYNWGQVSFTNKKGTATSGWIVLKSETFNSVVFTGNTYLQFGGKHIQVTGFKFTNGNSGANDVIQFRSAGGTLAHYCRINNITVDNYNSDSTGSSNNTGTKNGGDTLNRWVSIYGTHNRVDHCTFINKFNGSPTVVVWYDSTNYPAKGTSTYHLIDSNYFKGRGYLGSNEGEVIRVGTSSNSRTDGYNVIEYNLFEDGVQLDPEIISNKSGFNTYRYNTIRNHAGGITLREGRYCNVYGNFIIKTTTARSTQYGIRIIDKGHKVFNNYLENLDGNYNSTSSLRCPIILFNGSTNSNDTANPAFAAKYFAADSALVAFNTIVNCYGGAGIVVGFLVDTSGLYKPHGVTVANNLIKMKKGQAVLIDTYGTGSPVTYFAEGNLYNASKLGVTDSTGFYNKTLTFGKISNGILPPPSLVKDAAFNSADYAAVLNGLDAQGHTRSAIYDVGAVELNGSGNILASPLDSTKVGAGTPIVPLPVRLLSFTGSYSDNIVKLDWSVANEKDLSKYEVECSSNGYSFATIDAILANGKPNYNLNIASINAKNYYRLKMISKDGSFYYSNVIEIATKKKAIISVYPNPAKEIINVNVNKIPKNTRLVLVDNCGKQLMNVTINEGLNTFSIKEYAVGVYHLQLIDKQNVLESYPVIINK